MESLGDRETPAVAPGVDREVAAWRAVLHGASALAVDGHAYWVGVMPPHRVVAVLSPEPDEDLLSIGSSYGSQHSSLRDGRPGTLSLRQTRDT
jgi:magnesium transporter